MRSFRGFILLNSFISVENENKIGYFDTRERLLKLYICYIYTILLPYIRFDLLYFSSVGFSFFLFYQTEKYCLISDTVFFVMSVRAFYSLPKGEYLNSFIVAAFSGKSFSGKTSLLVKNSYLLIFIDDKAEILAVCLFKLY